MTANELEIALRVLNNRHIGQEDHVFQEAGMTVYWAAEAAGNRRPWQSHVGDGVSIVIPHSHVTYTDHDVVVTVLLARENTI